MLKSFLGVLEILVSLQTDGSRTHSLLGYLSDVSGDVEGSLLSRTRRCSGRVTRDELDDGPDLSPSKGPFTP